MAEAGLFLYERLARDLSRAISEGVYGVNERMPSLRRISEHYGVSLATAVQTYQLLEDQGLLQARPKSGYFVRENVLNQFESPGLSQPPHKATKVNVGQLAMSLVAESKTSGLVKLGAAVPGRDMLPVRNLSRVLAGIARTQWQEACGYEDTQGTLVLRRQIARLMRQAGCDCTPDDLVITNGCLEALTLALRTVAGPGDTVAIESPTYFGVLQVIESLGMKAVEIATDSEFGMNYEDLEKQLSVRKISACILMPNHSNPTGACLSDQDKNKIVSLLAKAGTVLIEDDVYGALSYRQPRPKAAKAFDVHDQVILCSSFSKTIAPGYRVGWVFTKRYRERILYQKFLDNISTASLPQLALATFLSRGAYTRTIRHNVQIYRQRMDKFQFLINQYFPPHTRLSRPSGGFVLWAELPESVGSMKLYELAMAKRIAISPGELFCTHGQYHHHLRLSCGVVDGEVMVKAVKTLGKLAYSLM